MALFPAIECQARPAVEEMVWTEDAERMLERIPSFVRIRVRVIIEKKARAEGITRITSEFMVRHRPFVPVMLGGGNSP